jgi:molybdopterin converting factor small subunit
MNLPLLHLTTDRLDATAVAALVTNGDDGGRCGAVVTFVGLVRGENLGRQIAHPPMASFRQAVAVAVNETFARYTTRLQDGDVVALPPPVSGG